MNATVRARITYRLSILLGTVILFLAPGVANASTALLLGGKGIYATLSEEQMATAFGGYFATYDKRVSVPFPGSNDLYYSVQVGTENLYAAVYDPAYAGPKTIGGVSEGAPAVIEVLRRLEADRADETDGKIPPPLTELNVAIYGSPSKRFLGDLKNQTVPVTPYDIIIVKAEYDGIADFPDNTFNLLAVTNAVIGAVQLHVKQSYFDIRNNPTEYTVVTNAAGGTTTTILIPTPVLPILAPMVALHFDPKFVAGMDKLMRPMIDSAYKRPPMQTGIPPTLSGTPGLQASTTPAAAVESAAVESASVPVSAARPEVTTRARTARRVSLPAELPAEAVTPTHEVADDSDEGTQRDDELDDELDAEKAVRETDSETQEHEETASGSEQSADTSAADTRDQPSTAADADRDTDGGSAGDDSQ